MKPRNRTNVNVSLSIPLELRDWAREMAYADNRSLSSYIASLLQRQYQGNKPRQPVPPAR